MSQTIPKLEDKELHNSKCLAILKDYFRDYCSDSTIHGFKYLGERRSKVEKMFWVIVLMVSFYYCTFNMVELYQKWKRSPVIVSFATSETPIWEVPFPAVTICPRTKAIKTKFNFTHMTLLNKDNITTNPDQVRYFEYMSMVCTNKLKLFTDKYSKLTVDDEMIDFLIKVQPKFKEVMKYFSWCGFERTEEVFELFKPIITSEGICYSFNMLGIRDVFTDQMQLDYYKKFETTTQPKPQWSLETGYESQADLNAFPLRTVVPGAMGGVDMILLTYESDLDYICGDSLQGYKVILHHPARLPNARKDYFRVGLDDDVAVSVKPNMMTTSKKLKRYHFENRGCYITQEKKLRFFKTYNQLDCLLECLSNYTHKYCKCVGFYMPHDNSTPICGPRSKLCMDHANTKFLSSEISFKIVHPEHTSPRNISEENLEQDCNCLPECDSLNFDFDVSLTGWNWRKGLDAVSSTNESSSYHLSRVRVFFKDMQFIQSQRNELYGITDFIANCGGLLGLFTGFSLISLVEFVYFITLRLACNIKHKVGIFGAEQEN